MTACHNRAAETTGGRAAQVQPAPADAAYASVLRDWVKNGRVDYEGLKAESAQTPKAYMRSLAEPRRFADQDAELAFWLNAYNACVLSRVVARHPRISRAMDVADFLKVKRWKVAGELRSLDRMENEIIRSRFKDPRIHFVLVCAARSCPPLQPRRMTGPSLEADLDRITRAMVNDARHVQLDAKAKRLRLARYMSWYRQDFVEKYGSLEAFLLRCLAEPARRQLEAAKHSIEFTEYD